MLGLPGRVSTLADVCRVKFEQVHPNCESLIAHFEKKNVLPPASLRTSSW